MRNKIGLVAAFGISVGGLAGAPPLAATADIVKSRIGGYRELGAAFKNVNDELKSGTPQVYIIQLSARQIRDTAKAQYGFFPAGSGPQPGVKTAAKPQIWARAAEFKAAQDAFAAGSASDCGKCALLSGGAVAAASICDSWAVKS